MADNREIAKNILVLDVGGSSIKYGIFDGKIRDKNKIPTPLDDLGHFLKCVDQIMKSVEDIHGIALSMPGIIDNKTGMVFFGGAIPYMVNVNIKEELERRFQVPVSVLNDGKAATMAEIENGCLKGVHSGIALIFGTGIGGGLAIDGKLFTGNRLMAGEFSAIGSNMDRMQVQDEKFGMICGWKGLSKDVSEASGLSGLNGIEIFQKIREGNEAVLQGVKKFCQKAAFHICNLQFVTDADVIAVGGGISDEPMFIELLKEEVKKLFEELPFSVPMPEITTCRYKSDANLLGAAYYFLHQTREVEQEDGV